MARATVEPPSMPTSDPAEYLESTCGRIRVMTLEMIAAVGKGHPGSSLSAVELIVGLYYREMAWDPARLDDPDRDRFVLSKGHAAPALYAVLIDQGVLEQADLTRLRLLDSPLQGHPDSRFTPGVEFATGSLGQGLSAAVGMALGLRRRGSAARVFALVGDGECQEGQVWEAANFAASQQLDNLCVLVDVNRLQHDDATAAFVGDDDLAARWAAFGWDVERVNGHSVTEVCAALSRSRDARPRAVIAMTVKGKGVDFMENEVEWHSVADASRLPAAVEQLRAEK